MLITRFRYLFLLLALGWAVLIFYFSSKPGMAMPPLFSGQDKLVHFIAYGALGFFVMGSMKTTSFGYRPGQALLAIALVTIYGVLDEIHQHSVPGRVTDIYDVMADVAGGTFGAFTMYFFVSKLPRSKK